MKNSQARTGHQPRGGAVQRDLVSYDAGALADQGLPPTDYLDMSFWRAAAESDEYGWDVDPDSVVVRAMDSEVLAAEWGPRYCVVMRRKGGGGAS